MNAPAQCRLASPDQAPELLALWQIGQIGQIGRRGEPIPTTYLPQPDPTKIERLHAARYVVVTAVPQG